MQSPHAPEALDAQANLLHAQHLILEAAHKANALSSAEYAQALRALLTQAIPSLQIPASPPCNVDVDVSPERLARQCFVRKWWVQDGCPTREATHGETAKELASMCRTHDLMRHFGNSLSERGYVRVLGGVLDEMVREGESFVVGDYTLSVFREAEGDVVFYWLETS